MIDTQRTLAYDQLFLCWRLPQDSTPAWHYSVEFRRRGVVPGGGARGGIRGGLAAARWGWQRLEEVTGTCAVIDRLEMDSVYVLRVRGCNKAGFGEYSEEVYLHTPPAPGKKHLLRIFPHKQNKFPNDTHLLIYLLFFFYPFPSPSLQSLVFQCFPAFVTTALFSCSPFKSLKNLSVIIYFFLFIIPSSFDYLSHLFFKLPVCLFSTQNPQCSETLCEG